MILVTSFTMVLDIFQDYLQRESCVEVLPIKWGYVRLYYEEPYEDSFDAVLCRTPEELFEVLLSDYRGYEEIQITKGRREVTEDDEKLAEQFCQRLRERWEEETK